MQHWQSDTSREIRQSFDNWSTLSHDPSRLTVPHPPYATVLTGTYGVDANNVFVSLKLIRTDNAQVLSIADFVLPRYGDVDTLLR